jgi:hypothetical protein
MYTAAVRELLFVYLCWVQCLVSSSHFSLLLSFFIFIVHTGKKVREGGKGRAKKGERKEEGEERRGRGKKRGRRRK